MTTTKTRVSTSGPRSGGIGQRRRSGGGGDRQRRRGERGGRSWGRGRALLRASISWRKRAFPRVAGSVSVAGDRFPQHDLPGIRVTEDSTPYGFIRKREVGTYKGLGKKTKVGRASRITGRGFPGTKCLGAGVLGPSEREREKTRRMLLYASLGRTQADTFWQLISFQVVFLGNSSSHSGCRLGFVALGE